MSSKTYPAIPEPQPTVDSLTNTVSALKQTVEIMLGLRGLAVTSGVTFQDLVDLGLIAKTQVPTR